MKAIVSIILLFSCFAASAQAQQSNRLLRRALPGNWTATDLVLTATEGDDGDDNTDNDNECAITSPMQEPFSLSFRIRRFQPVEGDARYFGFRFVEPYNDTNRRFTADNVGEQPRNKFYTPYIKHTPTSGDRTFLTYTFEDIAASGAGYTATLSFTISENYGRTGSRYCAYTYSGIATRS